MDGGERGGLRWRGPVKSKKYITHKNPIKIWSRTKNYFTRTKQVTCMLILMSSATLKITQYLTVISYFIKWLGFLSVAQDFDYQLNN